MVDEINIDRMKDWIADLDRLYKAATEMKEYENVVGIRDIIKERLGNKITPDIIFQSLKNGYWAEYYLLLKNPNSFTAEDRNSFLKSINEIEDSLTISIVKAELLYLKSVVCSNLMNDQENADVCNRKLHKMILDGHCLIDQMIKGINARMIKEMGMKNWEEATKIGNELEEFPEDLRMQTGNIGPSANVLSNRGASKIRGGTDTNGGIKDLVIALDYYLKQASVPIKHIEGVRNRLMEATKKM